MKDYHTTPAHFEIFKKECLKWIDFFELNEWKIYFLHLLEDKDRQAACLFNAYTTNATLLLSVNWEHDKPTNDWIKQVALHEVIHLLLAKLQEKAMERYVSEAEIRMEVETLTHKIEHILDKLAAK